MEQSNEVDDLMDVSEDNDIEPNEELYTALNENNVDEVLLMLENADLDIEDINEIFVWAIDNDHTDVIDDIIDRDFDNLYPDETWTYITMLIDKNYYAQFNDLLNHVDLKNEEKMALLNRAIFRGLPQLYQILTTRYPEVLSENFMTTMLRRIQDPTNRKVVYNTFLGSINPELRLKFLKLPYPINGELMRRILDLAISGNDIETLETILRDRTDELTPLQVDEIFRYSVRSSNLDLLAIFLEKGIRLDNDYRDQRFNSEIRPIISAYYQKLDRLDSLSKRCINMLDPISQDRFNEMSLEDLDKIIALSNGNCYPADTLYQYVKAKIDDNLPINDPLNPAYRLTSNELERLYAVLARDDPAFVRPSYISRRPPANLEFVVEDEGEFYHLWIENHVSDDRIEVEDIGYIPADIDTRVTGSTSYTSVTVITNLRRLWESGRLIYLDNGQYHCCSVGLNKNMDYWDDRTIDKFIDLAGEIERLL